MSNKKTRLIRIRESTVKKVRDALPTISTDADRFDLVHRTSAVSIEGRLKDKDFLNSMGKFIYGKKTWKRISGKER